MCFAAIEPVKLYFSGSMMKKDRVMVNFYPELDETINTYAIFY